jgi:Ca-activated chloride channel family protein
MRWCVGTMAGLLALGAGAQQQAPAPIERPPQSSSAISTIRVESRLVSVALNVVDDKGAPVPGLQAEDFELTEDARPEKIAVFERESATPLQIVLALDASESVFIEDKLEHDAAKSFIKSLVRPQDRIDLMAFADRVDDVVAFTNDAKAVESGLGKITHGSATALYDAIYLASQRLAQQPAAGGARRVIVLITDGENTTRSGSYDAALEQAERGEHALIQMAHDTGGKYYYVEDKHDLAPAFQHVSDDLRTQYTVGYYAPVKGVDFSGLRQIRLQLKDPALRAKYTLRYRTAYYGK